MTHAIENAAAPATALPAAFDTQQPQPVGCSPRATVEARTVYDVERRLDCRQYLGCLSYAIRRNWPGFTCASCAVREPVPIEPRRREHGANVLHSSTGRSP